MHRQLVPTLNRRVSPGDPPSASILRACRFHAPTRATWYETAGSRPEPTGILALVLTLFTVPKPFQGHVGDIQRNAIESWRALGPGIQVILVGDEEGVAEAASEAGVEHLGGVILNDRGTPRLDSAFERVETVAKWPLWCLVNADIILLDDFAPAVERVSSAFSRFLIVGEARNLAVTPGMQLGEKAAREHLRERALAEGRLRGYAALDYFVFPKGEFGQVPPFLIGRACFDNWLVWRIRDVGDPVIDATRSVVAVHQHHDYSHIAGGFDEAYYGEEAKQNERLAGGREHIYTLHDATHRLHRLGRPLPYWGSVFRARERLRSARVHGKIRIELRRQRRQAEKQRKQEIRAAAAARRAADRAARDARSTPAAIVEVPTRPLSPPSPVRLLAVAPAPLADWTQVLDELSRLDLVELVALYAEPSSNGAPPPEHVHWVPRSFMLPGARAVLGRDYRVNWAIWNSYRGQRPDCMLVSGWDTFATRSALAWCRALRVPYVLAVGESDGPVPRRIARGAAAVLVAGPNGQQAVLEAGVRPERVWLLSGDPRLDAGEVSTLVHAARR
jgi:hypothetical protein